MGRDYLSPHSSHNACLRADDGNFAAARASLPASNEGAPLNLTYTSGVTNPATFDPLFAETLAARIAAEIAVSLTESLGKAQALWQVYQQKLAEARRRDAQERNGDQAQGEAWALWR